ncbi:hypothetical protein [Nocardioides marmorisolisilvae]|uniref:Uncharacterized protein n=1 Tax=Nocardioides marmorisolisilvae TaxID=1542737 RepID=A0A3N0DU05_9ACTN|nr:hypothetical protein [Nocardioides marmorisolisilvae]RNL79090.1 hypothetical protein EFL95_08620 [Nocardioides marmorisolisilvae]
MSDDDLGTGPRGPLPPNEGPHGEPIGSVGEEAAKLFTALSGWAKDQGAQGADSAAGAAFAFGDLLKDVNDHIATGGQDCKYCPVCQLISAVRATSPEVKAHLTVAASSLMHAAAGVLATQVPDDKKAGPVEKINLDDDEGWDES